MPLFDFENRETGEVREINASSDLDNFKDESGTWLKLDVQPGLLLLVVAALDRLRLGRDCLLPANRKTWLHIKLEPGA